MSTFYGTPNVDRLARQGMRLTDGLRHECRQAYNAASASWMRRSATPVSQVDLYPTLAQLCGLAAPGNLQAQSLVPFLRDPDAKGRGWAISQVVRGTGKRRPAVSRDASSADGRYVGYSLRTPRWRYTEWDEGRMGHELYDHAAGRTHSRGAAPTWSPVLRWP